jgi:hypothetical protein
MAKKRSEIRLSLAIIAIAGLLAAKGVDFIRVALASSDVPAAGGSGLRLYARTAEAAPFLSGSLDIARLAAAEHAVTGVLQVWPLAGAYWLRLAEIRALSGGDIQSVIAAYQLSVLVAPFDGRMMMARQALGVRLWEVLSPDDRTSVVTDLASVWPARPAAVSEQLRAATASLSADGRTTLKAELVARSRLYDRELAGIGL